MAKKSGSKHVKRYAAPRAIKLSRKSNVWTTKASPGPHPAETSLPLRTALRDYLSVGRSAKEVGIILSKGGVLVDGKIRKEAGFPIGFMDVVQLPAVNRSYRVMLDHRRRLTLNEIGAAEASVKLCRVVRKQTAKGKKVQLALHDGKTLRGDLNEFKPGDVAKISLPETKVLERIPFEVGSMAVITGGSNVSRVGRVEDIKLITGPQPNIVTLKTDGGTFQSPEHYVFVVGRGKPSIPLPGGSK